ncbi:MAG: hypothetical protein WCV99_03060 [Sterolibacterium sp.]|jgi:hypothetical protein
MLKVFLHTGTLERRIPANQLGVLDIAYAKQDVLSDYNVAMSLSSTGELAPAVVKQYPRWSASLWDLTARALSQMLYRTDTPPSTGKPDRRCAYATRICAVIERATVAESGVQLGTVEIAQLGRQRGRYLATFDEDIQGARSAEFEYGRKVLNPADLLMRAICWAWFGKDVPGPRPPLILPPVLRMEGMERFHVEALAEPARTGFKRYQADGKCFKEEGTADLPRAEDYVKFLMQG